MILDVKLRWLYSRTLNLKRKDENKDLRRKKARSGIQRHMSMFIEMCPTGAA